jgi:hypothetical protein
MLAAMMLIGAPAYLPDSAFGSNYQSGRMICEMGSHQMGVEWHRTGEGRGQLVIEKGLDVEDGSFVEEVDRATGTTRLRFKGDANGLIIADDGYFITSGMEGRCRNREGVK